MTSPWTYRTCGIAALLAALGIWALTPYPDWLTVGGLTGMGVVLLLADLNKKS